MIEKINNTFLTDHKKENKNKQTKKETSEMVDLMWHDTDKIRDERIGQGGISAIKKLCV